MLQLDGQVRLPLALFPVHIQMAALPYLHGFCCHSLSATCIVVYLEQLCAYVGIGDGDSEGKHDSKYQPNGGLVDCCQHNVRCACCVS